VTLSERLEAARRARLEAVERLADPPRPEAVRRAPAPTPRVPFDAPPRVEVAAHRVHIVGDADPTDEAPRRCPTCNFEPRIDMVDLVGHTTHFSCTNCGTLWQVKGLHTTQRT
jgi:hypothetical protein